MRLLFTYSLLFACSFLKAQDGTLDPNYGNVPTGRKTIALSPPGGMVAPEFQRIASLPGGKILHAFAAFNTTTGNYDFGLARYESNGDLDITFDGDGGNGNGVVLTDFGTDEYATALTVREDGKIVVVGYKQPVGGGDRVFAIARFNSNGTIDASFNGTGKVLTAIGTDAAAYSVVQNNGVTVVVGYSSPNMMNYNFTVVRYLNNGSLDPTFDGNTGNGNGIVTTSVGGIADFAYSVAVQPDAKVVVGGASADGAFNYSFGLARYNIDGTLDNTFDTDGIVVKSSPSAQNDVIFDVAVTGGKIYAAGSSFNGSNNDIAVLKLNVSNGGLDAAFDGDGGNGNGIVITNVNGGEETAYSVGVQADGKVLVGGSYSGGSNSDFIIVRYNADGTIDDDNFNTSGPQPGINIIDFNSGGEDVAYDFVAQSNNIILAGRTSGNLATARLINSSTVLPLKLVDFTAVSENNIVAVNWKTQYEEFISAYEIERSTDGVNYTSIGRVPAKNGNLPEQSYVFQDGQPLTRLGYYRLKIISDDQRISYSRVVIVRFDLKGLVQAFPNPVSSQLNVQIRQPAGRVDLQVVDVSGKVVRQYQYYSTASVLSTSIDLSTLSKGMYFIKVRESSLAVVKN